MGMRPVAVLALAVLIAPGAAPAVADDDPAAVTWVGAWSGKVTLKGCADDGKKKVTLDVAVTSTNDLRSNGDILVEGFGDLDWIGEGGKLTMKREGLEATLTSGKKGAAFVLKTTGGCSIKGTLVRASSGIADCDRLRAIATIKSQCNALSSETRSQSLAEVTAAWPKWKKLKGKKKSAQGAACKDQAATLFGEIGSCSGVPSTGVPDCEDYMRSEKRYAQCDSVPQEARDSAQQGLSAIVEAIKMYGNDPYYLQIYADACKQANLALLDSASMSGCSL